MPPISRSHITIAQIDRSFEGSRHQERFLATAFEAVVPIIRRRPERIDHRREHPVAPNRQASPATRGG